MRSLTFTTSSVVALLLNSFVVGEESQASLLLPSPEIQSNQQTITKAEPEVSPIQTAYNAACCIAVDRTPDFFVTGSFTFWQPTQENMQLGVLSNDSNPDALVEGKEIDPDFEYKPGFKVGLGMNFDYDDWDTIIQYTWFRGTEKVHENISASDPSILLPAWQIPDFLNPQYKSGSEKWTVHMDLLDWDLGRSYFVGSKLCLRPFIGLRAAWIRQKLEVNYVNTIPSFVLIWPSTQIDQTAHSWAIGPRMGLCSQWKLGRNWRLYGNGEWDILFTQYDLKMKQKSAVTTASEYSIKKDDANFLRTHLDLALGIGWGSYFARNQYHFDLSADYGFQVFFDQNMFRKVISAQAVGANTLPNGNLYIQGMTITARFDF